MIVFGLYEVLSICVSCRHVFVIGGKHFSEGTSADREIQRTLMELLNQMDGFEALEQVKIIMATNRPDVLDPVLLRPGRLDRKIGECTREIIHV